MNYVAALCYLAALLAEVAGIYLVWKEAHAARTALTRYLELNPENHPGGSYAQMNNLQPVIVAVLGNQTKRRSAIALLVLGVAAGTTGNYLTL